MRRRLLSALAHLAVRWTWTVLIIALLISAWAAEQTLHLELKTGQMVLTPPGNPVRIKFKQFLEDFQVLDDIFLLVTYTDEKEAKAFARKLSENLVKDDRVKEVFFRLDLDTLRKKLFYLVDRDELDKILALVQEKKELMTRCSRGQDLKTLFSLIDELSSTRKGVSPDLDEVKNQLELVLALLKAMTSNFSITDKSDKSIWQSILLPPEKEDKIYDDEGYIISRKAKKLLIIVKSSHYLSGEAEVLAYFKAVRSIVDRTLKGCEGLSVGYAGAPAVTFDEKSTVEGDMLFSTILSMVGITLLFMISLQSFVHPVLGVLTLAVSLLWTFGVTRSVIGHLTIVSSTFTATLIGLGIGFGIHIVSCYEEERARDQDNDEAVRQTLLETGPGVITGATTSAAAFFTMLLTEFTAFQELGLIAGMGLLVTMTNMLLLLPALLTAKSRLFPYHMTAVEGRLTDVLPTEAERPWLVEIDSLCRRYPLLIAGLFGLAIGAAVPMALTIKFDYNLLNLQASSSNAVLNEHELVEDFNISPEFNAIIVPDIQTAYKVTSKLEKFTSVARIESISDLIPADLAEREKKIAPLRSLVEKIETRRKSRIPPPDPGEIIEILDRFRTKMKALRIYAMLNEHFDLVLLSSDLEKEISSFKLAFNSLPYEVALDRLSKFQKRLFDDLIKDLGMLVDALKAKPYTIDTIPKEFRDRFIGRSGKFVIYIFPSIDVRQEAYAKRFIRDTSLAWPDYTGLPTLKDEMVNLIRSGFFRASIYAFIALSIMVYLDFRRSAHAATVLFALCGGTVFMLSGMFILGVKFNPANFISLPIILGIGVDNGVHIMQRFLGGRSLKTVLLRTGRAITLNSMTTMIGFGSLALSSYKGFSTLGCIMVAGVASCYITAIVLQPALMYILMVERKPLKEQVSEIIRDILAFRP